MLARKSFLIVLTNVITGTFGVVSLYFIGRYFEPGPYGMFWFSMGLLGLLSALTKLGFEKAHLKRVAEGRDLGRCVGTFTRIKLIIILAFVAVSLAFVLVREFTVGWIAATTLPVLLVVIVYKILIKLRGIPKKTFSALRLTATNQTIILVENLSRLPLIIVITLAFAFSQGREVPLQGAWEWITRRTGDIPPMSFETGAVLLALAYTIPMALTLVLAFAFMRRHRIPRGPYDRDLAKSYWVFAWPVAGYQVLTTMTQPIDIVMLGYFWTGTEVGFYQAAYQFVAIVVIIPTAVRTLFFPVITELLSNREWSAVKELAVTAQRLMSLVMIPILMLTIVYADDVFRVVMSLTWVPAAPVLRLLVVHSTLSIFTTVVTSTLLGIERVKTVMWVNVVGVFLNISLNVVFIPESLLGIPLFGLQMTGAALASVIAKSVLITILFVISKRVFKTIFFSLSILKHLVAAGLVGTVLWTAEHTFQVIEVVRVWELAGASIVGVGLYVGVLWAMRELKRKDVLYFLDLIHPGRMGDYVKEELKGRRKD